MITSLVIGILAAFAYPLGTVPHLVAAIIGRRDWDMHSDVPVTTDCRSVLSEVATTRFGSRARQSSRASSPSRSAS